MKHLLLMLMLMLFAAGMNGQIQVAEVVPDTLGKFQVLNSSPPYFPSPCPLPPSVFSGITMPTCWFVLDSTPYRRVDSLKRAVDSLCLRHHTEGVEKDRQHQSTIAALQTQAHQQESTLERYKKLFITAMVLILLLTWMLFRVRRFGMRGKPLVLPYESAHDPTAGLP